MLFFHSPLRYDGYTLLFPIGGEGNHCVAGSSDVERSGQEEFDCIFETWFDCVSTGTPLALGNLQSPGPFRGRLLKPDRGGLKRRDTKQTIYLHSVLLFSFFVSERFNYYPYHWLSEYSHRKFVLKKIVSLKCQSISQPTHRPTSGIISPEVGGTCP